MRSTRLDGRPFIAAIAPGENLVVAGRPDGPNSLHVLDEIDAATNASVALTSQRGTVFVAWLAKDESYRLARRQEGTWSFFDPISVVGANYRGTQHFDIAVEDNGTTHLLFRNRADDALHQLRREPDGRWKLSLVDDGRSDERRQECAPTAGDPDRPGVGYDPDAAISSGQLFVAYYDGDCGDLRLARSTGESWQASVVDNGDFSIEDDPLRRSGNVGRFPSIGIDEDGRVAIAYHDVRRGRLLYASPAGESFDIALVDPGRQLDALSQKRKQLVGAFADLAFSETGVPYIAYMNTSENRLRLAHRARDADGRFRWVHRALSPDPPTGFFASIVSTQRDGVVVMAEQMIPGEGGVTSNLVTLSQEVR